MESISFKRVNGQLLCRLMIIRIKIAEKLKDRRVTTAAAAQPTPRPPPVYHFRPASSTTTALRRPSIHPSSAAATELTKPQKRIHGHYGADRKPISSAAKAEAALLRKQTIWFSLKKVSSCTLLQFGRKFQLFLRGTLWIRGKPFRSIPGRTPFDGLSAFVALSRCCPS